MQGYLRGIARSTLHRTIPSHHGTPIIPTRGDRRPTREIPRRGHHCPPCSLLGLHDPRRGRRPPSPPFSLPASPRPRPGAPPPPPPPLLWGHNTPAANAWRVTSPSTLVPPASRAPIPAVLPNCW